MAKQLKLSDIEELILKCKQLLVDLYETATLDRKYAEKVKAVTATAINKEVLKTLSQIPIEEINRGSKGIRIKALSDYGCKTIADAARMPVNEIANIRGISYDTARSIKTAVNDIANATRKITKVKINFDNKTEKSSQIVKSLLQFQYSNKIADEGKTLYRQIKGIEDTIVKLEDLKKSAKNSLRWTFTSKAKKDEILHLYEYLSEYLNNDKTKYAQKLINTGKLIENISVSDGWEKYYSEPIAFVKTLEEIDPDAFGNGNISNGLPEELANEIEEVKLDLNGIKCSLRPYQVLGVKYTLHQKRVLLGDDMGLGKTLQAIATIVSLYNSGATHFVVVCPASVITNWCREINKFCSLHSIKIYGNDCQSSFGSWLKYGGIAVTTYETTAKLNLPENFKYKLLVVDEAHYIKNPQAKRTINIKRLASQSERLMFMTGTALENRVDEMISLINILQPSVAKSVSGMEVLSTAPQFRAAVAPVYFRRKKEDVLNDLPELIETKEWCSLSPYEESEYEQAVLSNNYAATRRVSWNVKDINKSTKAKRLLELVDEAHANGRKVLIFSFFLDTIHTVKELLGDRCTNPITGAVSPKHRQEIIDEFDKSPSQIALIAQIQSGGTGLNIQSASVVIICEPQFKPSIENQAISRAHRMGQRRNVLVYRLLCNNTVDERISELLDQKQEIFNAFADKSVAAESTAAESKNQGIDNNTFAKIMKEEQMRIKGLSNPTFTENSTNKINEETISDAKEANAYIEGENGMCFQARGWFEYHSLPIKESVKSFDGKWMYFTNDQKFAKEICQKAIAQKVCAISKCTDKVTTGLPNCAVCFYGLSDSIQQHKRIIKFMLDNNLIQRTNSGRLYNASYKFNDQTKNGEYGTDFKAKISLNQFVDLNTGEFLV